MEGFIAAHWGVLSVAVAYAFLAFVSALPTPGDPRPVGQKVYETFYTTLHLLSNKVIEKRPGLALPAQPAPNVQVPLADPVPKQMKV